MFVGEGGTVTAWWRAVSPTAGMTMFDDASGGAVYKGLPLASNGGANFLYAADFHNSKIDVFDKTFKKVAMPGKFQDPTLPTGFAPFGMQAIGSKLFVTYAKQNAAMHDNLDGPGLVFVDVFDPAGNVTQRIPPVGTLHACLGA